MPQEYPSGWEVLYSQKEIEEAIAGLVEELLEVDGIYDKPVVLVQILESAKVFAEAIKKNLIANGVDVRLESIKASSYRGKSGEQGELEASGLEKIKLTGTEIVFVVDDMVDSGVTMEKIISQVMAIANSAPVFATVLLQKICSTFIPKFAAIRNCPDRWVAGYGINGNSPEELGEEDGRDLPDIIARVQDFKL